MVFETMITYIVKRFAVIFIFVGSVQAVAFAVALPDLKNEVKVVR